MTIWGGSSRFTLTVVTITVGFGTMRKTGGVKSMSTKELNLEIGTFLEGINRGPFKCLEAEGDRSTSSHVKECNKDIGDVFDCAVQQAWLDLCRTVSGAGNTKRKELEKRKKSLAEALREYFKGDPKTTDEAFDGWFGSIGCDLWESKTLTVGQAQKMINMAFKYLYCCTDLREEYTQHFAKCHMPLDSFTLNWYKDNCACEKYHGEAWSKIDNVELYQSIVREIRDSFGDETVGDATVLEKEIAIWHLEKQKNERKELKASIKKIMNYASCSPELNSQLQQLLDSIE